MSLVKNSYRILIFKKLSCNSIDQFKAITLFKVMALVLLLIALSLTLLPYHYLINRQLIDDSFYEFTIAYNIGTGKGITIDGHLPTNGFQPAFVFLISPIFWLLKGDKYLAIRLIFLVHFVFYIAAAFLFAIIARKAFRGIIGYSEEFAFWCVFLLYLSNPEITSLHFNGLETGCLLFFYSMLWWYYQKTGLQRWRDYIIFGILLGLTILVRIDVVFLVIIISLFQFFHPSSIPFRIRLGRFLLIAGLALIISSPWWLYNLLVFGNFQPTSGLAQKLWAIDFPRVKTALQILINHLSPFNYSSLFWLPTKFVNYNYLVIFLDIFHLFLLIGGIFILLSNRHSLSLRLDLDKKYFRRSIIFGLLLAIFGLVLLLYYTLSSWALFFYHRYFCVFLLFGILLSGVITGILFTRYPKLVIYFFIAVTILISMKYIFTVIKSRIKPYVSPQLKLVQDFVPEREYVGAGQSGRLGYFRERTINLDGKVNFYALRCQDITWDHQKGMPEFLRKNNINWICDWRPFIVKYLGKDPIIYGWRLIKEDSGWYLYHYEGSQ